MSKSENQADNNLSENMGSPLLKVNEVASLLNESVHIIRNWLKDFKEHIPLEKSEAGYNLFGPSGVDVLRTIQRLHREHKYSIKQIDHYFSTGGKEFVPKATPAAEELLAKELQEMKEALAYMREQMDKQTDFNQALVQRLAQQQQTMELQTSAAIRELQETKQLAAAAEQKQLEMIRALPKPTDPREERQERVTEMITRRRAERELEQEALRQWSQKPEAERMKRSGLFRKEEDRDKRDLFIKEYMDKHYEDRLRQQFGIDIIS